MELLRQLQAIPGPSGDEGDIADFLEAHCGAISGVAVERHGDLLLATKGEPRVAVFAHTDTIGFTLAHERQLYNIGGPKVEGGERLRSVSGEEHATLRLRQRGGETRRCLSGKKGEPGTRWVYADPLKLKGDWIRGPYLDNRAGVWNALRVLEQAENVAVVFTPGEEHSGRGAAIGARLVYEQLQITQALISDITWHTQHVRCGKGPAISRRDRSVPRQRFLERVVAAAQASGVPFQLEIESDGGSDGSTIERSGYPIDWVFIGAPEKRPHTVREACRVSDLQAMVELYLALIPRL